MPRAPLDAAVLQSRLPPRWTHLDVVEHTASTNAELLADDSAAPYRVLVAEHQSAGRGRLERSWSSPPRAGLLFSARVRPAVPLARWGWLPLLAGVALADAVTDVTGVAAGLKWPNDLLAARSGGKLAGILVQTAGRDAVLGIGLNVDTSRAELPVDTATSLVLEGAVSPDRTALLSAILTLLAERLETWAAAGGDAARCGLDRDYRARCATLGRRVTAVLGPDGVGGTVAGTALDVDDTGRLVLDTADGPVHVGSGDVTHVRPA